MKRLGVAETLLQRHGITDPREIDLEVLAYAVGARVKYRAMETCEARITGIGDRAVITIDDRYGERRARFSLAHELGHWQYHRHQRLYCTKQDIGSMSDKGRSKEREADRYAAELMMPRYLFEPLVKSFNKPSFASIDQLAEAFDASRKATALRFVHIDRTPSMLICYGPHGRKWYRGSHGWPQRWVPKPDHDPDSDVMELLFGNVRERPNRGLYPASAFFSRRDAESYDVYAHSVVSGSSADAFSKEVLTLIMPKDFAMVDESDW